MRFTAVSGSGYNPRMSNERGREQATFAGGCFWCVEAVFDELRGVERVESGYAGGHVSNPSYQQVCTGMTGHAEVVRITYDPNVVSYRDLLGVFFSTHDPTQLNRQGADVGTQYRSAVFYHTPEQRETAREVIAELEAQKVWDGPIVTTLEPLTEFYPAEEYHRDYYRRNPEQGYCRAVVAPKVAKFRKQYFDRLKK
jgi:peptide-methionine (S)-S-oxide reductase